jgi:acyl-CoA reductase-like NAD-dependent aldehyde dehydrogenase
MSQSVVTPNETKAQAKSYPFLLNGRWLCEGRAVEIRAPYDQSLVGVAYEGTRAHAKEAIDAAVRAFEKTRRMPAYERQRVLQRIVEGLRRRRDEIARVMTQEAGKPIKMSRAEVERAILTFSSAAEEATRLEGDYLPLDVHESGAGRWGLLRRFPLGAISAITPFNFPLNLPAHKVAPAIACGCTMVLKPAPQDPLTTLMLAEVVHEAGWPEGALNVVPLSNQDAAPLVDDERLKLLSFTGSAAVGWQLKNRVGKKRIVLELGGNAGVIVHGDAELGYAAGRCATGSFAYGGQTCISVQRIFVERSIYAAFTELLVAAARKLKIGNPLEDSTDVGPLIREQDAQRAADWVQQAVNGGAKLLCGGKATGSLLEPTVLTNTRPEMQVNCEEIFAPVVTVEPYDDFNDALRDVNDSPYGLQAGVFTRDARLIFQAYEELEVGAVIIGDIPSWRVDPMPYGGVKESGMGREGVRYAIEDMTERKLLVMNLK